MPQSPPMIGSRTATTRRETDLCWKIGMAGILLVAFILRLTWMIKIAPHYQLEYEGYYGLAKGLVANGQLGNPNPSAFRLPAYPAFLAVAMLLGDSSFWLRSCSVLLSTALVGAIYGLIRCFGLGRGTALVGAALCAFNPTFVMFSPVLASEHLFALLLVCAMIVLLIIRVCLAKRIFFASILFGTAMLTRGEGLFYLPLFAWLAWATTPATGWRWGSSLMLLAVCFCVLFPWYCRNYFAVGPGVGLSSAAGLNFYFAHNNYQYGCHSLRKTPLRGLDEVERAREATRLALGHLQMNGLRGIVNRIRFGTKRLLWDPATYAFMGGSESPPWDISVDIPLDLLRLKRFVEPLMNLFYFVLIAGAISSAFLLRNSSSRTVIILWGVIFLNWAGYAVIFWATPRYRYISEVSMCLLSAIALTTGAQASIHLLRRWGINLGLQETAFQGAKCQ